MNLGSVIKGIIIGVIVPFVGYALLLTIVEWLGSSQSGISVSSISSRTMMLIAIVFNLIAFQFFNYRRETETMRGLMIITVLYAIIWAIYFQFFSGDPFL